MRYISTFFIAAVGIFCVRRRTLPEYGADILNPIMAANCSILLGSTTDTNLKSKLSQNDKAFKGVTYSYKTTVFYGKASW